MNELLAVKRHSTLAEAMANLAINSEITWSPQRLEPLEHWIGHIPFAFWLIKTLRPRTLVELGTHLSNSYLAFCQAIESLQIDCRAMAVDTWEGDLHMGREEGILEELRKYHDRRYDRFSSLMVMTFDEARERVEAGTIDLLHIDGAHTYEAARHDFANWKSAMSNRGVVLFHDVNVHRDDFGVWRLWSELTKEFPSFGFLHGYGLGVLGVGQDLPAPLRELFTLDKNPQAATLVRSLFETRGQGLVSLYKSQQLDAAMEARLAELHETQRKTQQLESGIATKDAALDEMRREKQDFDVRNRTLEAQLEEKEAQLEENEAQLIERDAANRNLHEQMYLLGLEAAEGRQKLANLQAPVVARLKSRVLRTINSMPPPLRLRSFLVLEAVTLRRLRKRMRGDVPAPKLPRRGSSAPRESQNAVAMPDVSALRTFEPSGRIAVVAHVHYADLWPELKTAIGSITEGFDLFVSVTRGAAEAAIPDIRDAYPRAQIFVFPNHGRDILPFLTLAGSGVFNNYDLICKLHTKNSLHRSDGDQWRQTLLGGILGGPEQVSAIVNAFENDPDLGIVVAPGHIYGHHPNNWVDNLDRLFEIGARIGIDQLSEGATFPGGSIYWMRPFLLRTLLGLRLTPADFEPEPLPRDGSTAHAVERLIGLVCSDAGMACRESNEIAQSGPKKQPDVRLIAYYLPQFHPTPENDAWWGKGFTEWSNVTRARPNFRHHNQPRLPADLGYYDLRMGEIREEQAKLAREHGVSAFCYYYYWFNGRGVLRLPLDEMAVSGKPDLPFMICWANEPWSRNWDGGNREVLLPQDYQDSWERSFARDVAPLLRDARYVHVDGKPMILIYRVMHIPALSSAIGKLRQEFRNMRIGEVHIAGGWVGFAGDDEPPDDPAVVGLDSWVEFPPHRVVIDEIVNSLQEVTPGFRGKVYHYRAAVEFGLASLQQTNPLPRYRSVMAGWDNTARRLSAAHTFHGATPALFRRWLRGVVQAEARRERRGEKIVFINAWNEWAEGAYLEPDTTFGRGWLEAVSSASGPGLSRAATPAIAARPKKLAAAPRKSAAAASGSDETLGSLAAQMNDGEWLELMIKSAESQNFKGAPMPAYPAASWQAMFVGSSNAHAMREAAGFVSLIKAELDRLGLPLTAERTVVDFGSGWGRYIRLMMKDIPRGHLFGLDVDPDMVGFCKISGLPAQFAVVPPFGPSEMPDHSVDLIYAYSVFSHLSEDAHLAWMREFRRMLKPFGVAIATTQARRFLTWTESLRAKSAESLTIWEQSLARAFPDIAATIADYDRGRFIFAPTGGGDHRSASFYGEAAVPEAWMRSHCAETGLVVRGFIDDAARCPQAVAILQALP